MGTIINPFVIRELIGKISNDQFDGEFSDGRLGVLVSKLNTALKQFEPGANGEKKKNFTDRNRRLVLGFLFGNDHYKIEQKSSKELTTAEKFAIERWIYGKNPKSDSNNHWIPRDDFCAEARWVLNVAVTIDQMTSNPGAEKPPMSLITAIETIRPYVLYSLNHLETIPGEDTGMVAEALNLPGAIPVNKPLYPNRTEYKPTAAEHKPLAIDISGFQPERVLFPDDDDLSSL